MHIVVTNRDEIESGILIRTSYAVISIRDPDRPKPRIRRQSGLRAVLSLAFHDAEPSLGFTLPGDIVVMTAAQAHQIWAFVREQDAAGVESIVVHCEQGMSRSPAVAAAINDAYGDASGQFFRDFAPNRFVYEMMRSQWKSTK